MKTVVEFSCDAVSYRVIFTLDGHKLQSSTQRDVWTTMSTGRLEDCLTAFMGLIRKAVEDL